MNLLPEIERAWKEIEAKAADQWGSFEDETASGSYTERDPISDTWNTRGRIVRLDSVIFALHMMAARHCFVAMPKLYALFLDVMLGLIRSMLVKAAAKKLIGQRAGRGSIVFLIQTIASTIFEANVNSRFEASIRKASFDARADLYTSQPMTANPKRARKTKLVFTRHPSPRQRKPNHSWRSPKR